MFYIVGAPTLLPSCFTILAGRVPRRDLAIWILFYTDFLRDDPRSARCTMQYSNITFAYVAKSLFRQLNSALCHPHSRCNSAAKKTLFSCVSRACLFEGRARVLSLLRESLVDTRVHIPCTYTFIRLARAYVYAYGDSLFLVRVSASISSYWNTWLKNLVSDSTRHLYSTIWSII